jgi:hypothetical protein
MPAFINQPDSHTLLPNSQFAPFAVPRHPSHGVLYFNITLSDCVLGLVFNINPVSLCNCLSSIKTREIES